VAVNCLVRLVSTRGLAGVTAIDSSTAGVTVTVLVPTWPARLALTREDPRFNAVTRPLPLIGATTGSAEAQFTCAEISRTLASENVPVAAICKSKPLAMPGSTGVTAIDCSVTALTVIRVLAESAPVEAVIVEVPAASALARPPESMLATAGVFEFQVTDVRVCVDPFE